MPNMRLRENPTLFQDTSITSILPEERGDLFNAIENALKSEKCLTDGERDHTYSEIGSMFKELGIV